MRDAADQHTCEVDEDLRCHPEDDRKDILTKTLHPRYEVDEVAPRHLVQEIQQPCIAVGGAAVCYGKEEVAWGAGWWFSKQGLRGKLICLSLRGGCGGGGGGGEEGSEEGQRQAEGHTLSAAHRTQDTDPVCLSCAARRQDEARGAGFRQRPHRGSRNTAALERNWCRRAELLHRRGTGARAPEGL